MRLINKALLASIVIVLALVMCVSAQDSRPKFEVASVKPRTIAPKPGEPTVGLSIDASKGRFVATNVTVKLLLRYAFDLQLPTDEMQRGIVLFSSASGIQVIGGPNWINSEHFDIEAKPTDSHAISQDDMQQMTQSLLEERFQLKWHYEMREVPVYDLVVAKEGKLRLSDKKPTGLPPLPQGRLTVYGGKPGPSGIV